MNLLGPKLLLASALVQVVYGVFPSSQNGAKLLFRPHLAFLDTSVSRACFSNYIATSNEASKAFSQDYSRCLLEAKAGRQATETEMADKRIAIKRLSQNICQRLSACDGRNTTLEVFDCHAQIGANNTKAIYNIYGNASEHANILQEQYRIVDVRHEQCCKSGERRYVESTAANYRNLQDCLDGRIKPSFPAAIATTLPSSERPPTTQLLPASTAIGTQPSPKITERTTSKAAKSTDAIARNQTLFIY